MGAQYHTQALPISSPDPTLSRGEGLVNQVEFLGLAGTLATV